MNSPWRCAVCETVNYEGRTCAACGATMTRRSTVVTAARARVTPVVPEPTPPAPLPAPVRRAISREPVPEEEWVEYEESTFDMVPIPGGCLFNVGPRGTW
jgi:hypothetical protein